MKKLLEALGLCLALAVGPALAEGVVPVTVDAFVRAEADRYFKARADRGCLGVLCHDRMPVAVDNQTIIRMNRDTPYSMGVFDLTSPLTLTVPDIGSRFQSVVVINEDHYITQVIYKPGTYTFTKDQIGTRYVQLTVRTFVNPDDPADVEALHKAQDGLVVQQDSIGTFEVPDWDQDSLNGLRKAILSMSPWVPDSKGMFGNAQQVDPVRHLIGTAGGFGGNREEDAIYLNMTPEQNDGVMPYVLTLDQVPVDGFWSVIVYNKDGFFEAPETTVSVNSVTAKQGADGKTLIHFGGDPAADNYLRIMPGWTYMVRLYRPRPEILDGTWTFPEAVAVK
ncbi:MAG: DUF1214 domain-containing protein [Alphaproteobacteria bacterium]